MFRRTRPHKHTVAAPTATQPMTNPFAFVRAPTPMAAGGLPTVPNSNPPTMQPPPNNLYSQAGPRLSPHPQSLQDVPPASTGSSTPSLSGVTLFNPQSTVPPGVFPAPGPAVLTPSYTEQSYFNSREPPSVATEPPHEASGPAPSHTTFNQDYAGHPSHHPVSFQPVPHATSPSQWASDHGSRPPSVQNYFQPTSDPPTQPINMLPHSQMYPPHIPSPRHNTQTPPTQPGYPVQAPLQHPGRSPYPDPNTPQQPSMHPPMQNYFSQRSNHSPLDSGYHQMGSGLGEAQPCPDSASHCASSTGPVSPPTPHAHSQESSTLSLFFKDDVENEETLAGEANKAVNGVPESFHHHSSHQAGSQLSGDADVSFDYHGASLQPHLQLPYMNDENYTAHGNNQKPPDSQYDHVENLECVPNQEVLPNESLASPAPTAAHGVDLFETGPNLETPDSVPRPIRSASVSSNYSNMSHGSGTGSRRHQGVVGTFIQQESPRLADDANLPAATGGYFEQIDNSSAGEMSAQQNAPENNWPPTPSPPKPVGIFQASANSSFEPVRSHGVGVRPVEVDRANMVVEGGADITPGNLEQPPDNMENIYSPGHPLPTDSGGSVPHITHPVVHSHSRPSSRAYGVSRPCESPATTLWAQNDPSSLGTNIVLAPAAPTVLAPLREPSSDVIQPPEDGPLDLHPPQTIQSAPQQHSENLENPPKVSEVEPADPQGSLGYASLLVSDSLHQAILIAPPVSNYNVITPCTQTQAASQSGLRESSQPVRLVPHGQTLSTSSNQNLLSAPSSNQDPLDLTRDKTETASSEITPLPQHVHAPLSRGLSMVGDSQSVLCLNPQASLVTSAVSNHNHSTNYELLDFSMHQSQTQNQASGHSSSLQDSQQCSNGFYLQVTKDAQQSAKAERDASLQTPVSSSSRQGPLGPSNPAEMKTQQPLSELTNTKPSASRASLSGQTNAPPVSEAGAQSSLGQFPIPTQGPASGAVPSTGYPPGPQGSVPSGPVPPVGSYVPPTEPPRPPSTAGSQQGYGPPPGVPSALYGGYYGGIYEGYPDNRASYPPGQYPPPPGDPRTQQYYVSDKSICAVCKIFM